MNTLVSNSEHRMMPVKGATDQGLTVTNAVISFAAFADNTRAVLVSVDTQPLRVTFDGSNPTTTNGHYLPTGYEAFWSKQRAEAAKFIRATGTDGYAHASPMTH